MRPRKEFRSTPLHTLRMEDFVLLPGRKHGQYSYDDLLVTPFRVSYQQASPAVRQRGLQQAIAARFLDGDVHNWNGYLGNVLLSEARLIADFFSGGRLLTPHPFWDLLASAADWELLDGTGCELPHTLQRAVYHDIFGEGKKDPRPIRAEHLDLETSYEGMVCWAAFDSCFKGKTLDQRKGPLSEDCLQGDTTYGLELEGILDEARSPRPQRQSARSLEGLPTVRAPCGNDLWYTPPDLHCSARYWVDATGRYFSVAERASRTHPWLGFRIAFDRKEFEERKRW